MQWMLPNVSIISLYTFHLTKITQKGVTEDGDVGPFTTFIGSIYPDDVSSLNRQRHFVMQSALIFELVARESSSVLCNLEICSINSNETIRTMVFLEPIFKQNL